MTTPILKLPNELLLNIVKQSPKLAYACKRFYFLGYSYNALSIVGPGGVRDRNSFDSRRHSKQYYRRFSNYMDNLTPSAADSVRKLSISLGKCRNKQTVIGRTSYHTNISRKVSKLSKLEEITLGDPSPSDLEKMALSATVTDITLTLKKPFSRWEGVLSTLLRIAPGVKNMRVHFIAASVEDFIFTSHESVKIVNESPHLLNSVERVVFRVIPAMKKRGSPGEYAGLVYDSDYEDMIESCLVFDNIDNIRLSKGLCATHMLYALADCYGLNRCVCCVQDGLESAVVV